MPHPDTQTLEPLCWSGIHLPVREPLWVCNVFNAEHSRFAIPVPFDIDACPPAEIAVCVGLDHPGMPWTSTPKAISDW